MTMAANPNNKFVPLKIQESMISAIESTKVDARKYRAEKEKDMYDMLMADAKDLKEILSLCKKGKWKEAQNKAYHMDTAARDTIPDSMWGLIHQMTNTWRSF
jgi:hypothetical protein